MAARAAITRPIKLNELWESYREAAQLGRHKVRGSAKRASSLAVDEQRWRTHLKPALGTRAFADIRPADINGFLTTLARRGLAPATVNGVGGLLRGLLAYAVFQEWLPANPALGRATPFVVQGRDRVLSRTEFFAVWNALDAALETPMERGTALSLMLAAATLQRLGEVTGLEIEEVDVETATWTIPAKRSKGKRAHAVPLSSLALRIINEAHNLAGGGRLVFPSRREGEPMGRAVATRAFARMVDGLDIMQSRATPHDLRRTGASFMTGTLGIPRFIVSQVLGHASDTGGAAAVTAVYDRSSYIKEKRAALDAWAQFIIPHTRE